MGTAVPNAARAARQRLSRSAGARAVPAALIALLAYAGQVDAQELLRPKVSFDGFGTVGVAHSLEGDADFVENPTRGEGTGHTRNFDPALDSRFAGQVTVEAGPRLTGVVQVVLEMDSRGEYRPNLEWANIRYSITPELSVRAGRIVLPMFLVSETRKVSFANPWARPPVELYSLVPIYSWDGIDASYSRRIGDWTTTLNGAFGRAESKIPGGRAEADRFWSANASMQRGGFSGRVAAASGRVEVDAYTELFDGFRQFGPAGEEIVDRYEVDDAPLRFAAAGTEYDHGPWFTLAEVAWTDSESAMGERMAGYLTAGYRLGALTPYATVSRVGLLSESATTGLPLDGLPADIAQAAAGLNAGLNYVLRSNPDQRTVAIGTRWDVRSGLAVKGQIDFIDMLGDSHGTFRNLQPTFEPGGGAQVVSVAATFVF